MDNYDIDKINKLTVENEYIIINSKKIIIDNNKVYCSKINFNIIDKVKFNDNLDYFKSVLLSKSHEKSLTFLLDNTRKKYFAGTFDGNLYDRFVIAYKTIFDKKKYLEGIKRIHGLGFGLTPSGDDFIAGFFIGLYILEKMYKEDLSSIRNSVFNIINTKNLLSYNFIKFAKEGYVTRKINDLINAILYRDKKEIYVKTIEMISFGETSGSDTAVGLYLTIANFIR